MKPRFEHFHGTYNIIEFQPFVNNLVNEVD